MNIKRHIIKFSAGYIRGTLYGIAAFLAAFVSEFKGLSHEQVVAMTRFDWWICWAEVWLATVIVIRAFFDGTMEKISNAPDAGQVRKETSTTTTVSPPENKP